jgi:hypothetical protein
MSILADLEATELSEWLSISMLGFPTLIALHSVGMAVVVGLSLIVALRLNGLVAGIDGPLVARLLTIAAWGFVLNFLTGLALFITRGTDYITSAIFLVKMLLVIVSAIILFWLRERLDPADSMWKSAAADSLSRRLSLVAATTWFAAVVAGRLIAYLSDLYR